MSGFTPWRGTRSPVPSAPTEAADELALLRETNRQLRNDKAALESELRDTRRERDRLALQVRSGAAMLAAARRQCEAGCEHAKLAAARGVQLVEMQRVQNRLQSANQAYTEADLRPATVVPRQRRRTT